MHKTDKTRGINHINRKSRARLADQLTGLTSLSMLFIPFCGSFARRAARFATISNISFKMAPSAATSDELLSNPGSIAKTKNTHVYIETIKMKTEARFFTYFHSKDEHSIAL